MERKYHLSFDLTNSPGNFIGIPDIKTILQLLIKLGADTATHPCNNTIIFTYKNDKFDMDTFGDEIKKYFYFTLSLITSDIKNKDISEIYGNPEIKDDLFQKNWTKMKSEFGPK